MKNYLNKSIPNKRTKKNLIILLTTQRSGSTWLLDILRSHPNISFEKSYKIYRDIEGIFNRYPGHMLCRDLKRSIEIEISPNRFVYIPNLKVNAEKLTIHNFYIEKTHPVFFKNDYQAIIDRFKNLSKTYNLKIVYQVRGPISSMKSFLDYQKRDPNWSKGIDKNTVLKNYTGSIQCMQKIFKIFPGKIITYEQLFNNTKETITNIYKYIWNISDIKQIVAQEKIRDISIKITSRNTRKIQNQKFLGNRPNPPIIKRIILNKKQKIAFQHYKNFITNNSI